MVKDINPAPNQDSSPGSLTPFKDRLYFAATTGIGLSQIWKTDGTEAGTVVVHDVNPGADADIYDMATVADGLYFSATDGQHGHEIWRSDGTNAKMLRDIEPGTDGSGPQHLTPVGDRLVFIAEPQALGREPWLAESENVSLVKDILPGIDGSNGSDLIDFKGAIYLSANDGVHGYELWRIGEPPPPAPKLTIAPGAVTLDARGRLKIRLTCRPADAAGPCRGRLNLATAAKIASGGKKRRKRVVTLGAKGFTVAAGKTATVTITLKRASAALLRSNRAARRVKVTAKVQGGKPATRVINVKPLPVKPKKRRRK